MSTPSYVLKRVSSTSQGTFGVLLDPDGSPICVTLEDPWKNNEVGRSCIPEGTYECAPHTGTKYKDVWLVKDVPGRSAILIHQGNTQEDTRGCILVGRRFGRLGRKMAVLDSVSALNTLRGVLPQAFSLRIEGLHVLHK